MSAEEARLEELVAQTMQEFGRIDLLVNNAGGWPPQPALQTSERTFEQALRFNVTTAFLLTRLTVPHMLAGGGGSDLPAQLLDVAVDGAVADHPLVGVDAVHQLLPREDAAGVGGE